MIWSFHSDGSASIYHSEIGRMEHHLLSSVMRPQGGTDPSCSDCLDAVRHQAARQAVTDRNEGTANKTYWGRKYRDLSMTPAHNSESSRGAQNARDYKAISDQGARGAGGA